MPEKSGLDFYEIAQTSIKSMTIFVFGAPKYILSPKIFNFARSWLPQGMGDMVKQAQDKALKTTERFQFCF